MQPERVNEGELDGRTERLGEFVYLVQQIIGIFLQKVTQAMKC